jgi:superfamily II DNA or RNA helicase
VRVWLPGKDAVIRVEESELQAIDVARPGVDRLLYLAAAARIADALSDNVLLAPMQSLVTPLPHQLHALQRVMRGDRVRYLLADEVGLGKTIEAGLAIRELKLRGLVKRVLVVAPKGLTAQWQAEMRVHFNEDFRLLSPADFPAMRQVLGEQENFWRTADQVICALDSVKPMEARRGWKAEDVAEHNRERFDDLVSAGWDLVIIDEAHRMGGATAQVARHKLGVALSEAAPYILLLSATPHQGKTDAFHRLMTLIDHDAFPDEASISRERVQPYVIRTEKRAAIDATGAPLFKPRQTRLTPVTWEDRHYQQRMLYEAVTAYVRHGYNQALQNKQRHIGFLMILMQRLVTSSTAAIRVTLERRLAALQQASDPQMAGQEATFDEETWLEMDGEAQVASAIDVAGWRNEVAEVETLLAAARETEAAGTDAKAEALLELIYKLQQEEKDPELKVLVFTEFVPTQAMLADFLEQRGITIATLNGAMGLEQRLSAQREFAGAARVLVSTDAGGEGLNLQFCHVIVNFDMPWNPMRVEQRIGRVDRIGQAHVVRAINFILADTVEHRIREVLEAKLDIIAHEFGVDKASDVMDSVEAESLFDDLFVHGLVEPDAVDAECDRTLQAIREKMTSASQERALLPTTEGLVADDAKALLEHPLQVWLERMVVHYLRDQGGIAERGLLGWYLKWPDGREESDIVFDTSQSDPRQRACLHIRTLEEPSLRGLASTLPQWSAGMPIPGVRIDGLPESLAGVWSLWEISQSVAGDVRTESIARRFLPLFLSDEGRVYLPTARRIWDLLLTQSIELAGGDLSGDDAADAFAKAQELALQHGEKLYQEIATEQRTAMTREAEKMDYAFAARRRLIERVGLPAVRTHRLARLEQEMVEWRRQADLARSAEPSLVAVMMLRVGG